MSNSNQQTGVSKLSAAANSGNGDPDPESSVVLPTAGNSGTLTQTDRPRTKRGVSLSPGQTLEILQQSVVNCQAAGIDARVSSFYDRGQQAVVIVLSGVAIDSGNLIAINGKVLP